MAEPFTAAAFITGIVGAFKAYVDYRSAVDSAKVKQQPAPAKSEDAVKGEQAAPIVKAGIEQHGNEDERADLANFERNPDRYTEGFVRALSDIARREPAFAQQLQTLAQQANIQTGGVQGSVNVTGQGKVYGTAIGTAMGTVHGGNYTFGADDEQAT